MTNQTIIKSFIKGATSGHTPYRNIYGVGRGTTLRIEGDTLINYETPIAYRIGGAIILKNNKYSRTTSKIQTEIKRQVLSSGLELIETEKI